MLLVLQYVASGSISQMLLVLQYLTFGAAECSPFLIDDPLSPSHADNIGECCRKNTKSSQESTRRKNTKSSHTARKLEVANYVVHDFGRIYILSYAVNIFLLIENSNHIMRRLYSKLVDTVFDNCLSRILY